jgi:hypothetical protein
MPSDARFLKLVNELIVEGELLLKTAKLRYRNGSPLVDDDMCRLWANKLILLSTIAGDMIAPWKSLLFHNTLARTKDSVEGPLAALQTIRYAIQEGLLARYEDIVFAQAFADLFEQGAYLLEQGYFLAAGVIFRAILEERLRKLCDRHACLPVKARPTINDYNQSLYARTPPTYDKNMMLNVTALASVGNDAAHNKPELTSADIQRLRNGLQEFLARFSA